MFRDNVKARWLGADGVYRKRRPAAGEATFRVQTHLQEESRRLTSAARGVMLQPEEPKQRRRRPPTGR
jgi:hypothetical protein